MPPTRSDPLLRRKLVLGMVHLRPLPDAPGIEDAGGACDRALAAARDDARAILEGGADGLIIENFGDAPFHRGRVHPVTVAAMAIIASRLRSELADTGRNLPAVGINVLRNDALAALSIAAAAGLDFIRVNVHCGAMVTDQGIIEGRADETLRERARLDADVRIFADVLVKHAAPLAPVDPATAAREAIERGRADALIVTGEATGAEVDVETLERVCEAAASRVVLVGSGVTPENAATFLRIADGCIAGTSIKRDGLVHAPVDPDRVRRLVGAVRTVGSS